MKRFDNHQLPRRPSSGPAFRLAAHGCARGANIRFPTNARGAVGERRFVRRPGRRALGLMASGATCVQKLDGSRDSAIHTKYRILLRSSSMREPRYPLPRVVLLYARCHPQSQPANGRKGRNLFVYFPWRELRRGSFLAGCAS